MDSGVLAGCFPGTQDADWWLRVWASVARGKPSADSPGEERTAHSLQKDALGVGDCTWEFSALCSVSQTGN